MEEVILATSNLRLNSRHLHESTAKLSLEDALGVLSEEDMLALEPLNVLLRFKLLVATLNEDGLLQIPVGPDIIKMIEDQPWERGPIRIISGAVVPSFRTIRDMTEDCLLVGKGQLSEGFIVIQFDQRPDKKRKVVKHVDTAAYFPTPHISPTVGFFNVDHLDTHTDLNETQCRAINYALWGYFRSSPYLIRGPPGTGKTTTLVELVNQIKKRIPTASIIICTPSNKAADNVIERMCPDSYKVLRFISTSLEMKMAKESRVPGIQYSKRFSPGMVAVTTIGNLQKLYSDEGERTTACPTHIIVDEASMVSETDMILVLGLMGANTTKLIMFGDEKQLGPVIRANRLRHTFMETSYFERLVKDPKYTKQSITLLENYRSLPEIVKVFNDLFYRGELVAKVTVFHVEVHVTAILVHLILTGKVATDFPGLYMRNVEGECTQDEETMSWSNKTEAEELCMIVHKLITRGILAKDIGVITPYVAQVEVLQEMITNPHIVVGTVDSFQGQERKVIVISTVRSIGAQGIGFVGHAKRLNVTLSRAKSAMIIVGHEDTLKGNALFRKLFAMPSIQRF